MKNLVFYALCGLFIAAVCSCGKESKTAAEEAPAIVGKDEESKADIPVETIDISPVASSESEAEQAESPVENSTEKKYEKYLGNFWTEPVVATYGDDTIEVVSNGTKPEVRLNGSMLHPDISIACEVVQIEKVSADDFLLIFSEMGSEEAFILNKSTMEVEKLFIDIPNSVNINAIDFENKIIFADTWNSDKDIMPNDRLVLYLFSTTQQTRVQIAEKTGSHFSAELIGNNKIQYHGQDDELVEFDYSEWK